jgi:hypothetical protein
MKTERFVGTIEFLKGGRTAIITLTDSSGNWAGSSLLELPRAGGSLYDLGYARANTSALLKGGILDAFRREAA